MTFSIVAYLLAAFLTVFGGFFIWLSMKEPATGKIINPKTVLLAFAILYFGLAHFSVLTGLAYGVELTNEAPCENILANVSTYYVYGDNYTGYHWDYTTPGPQASDINLFHQVDDYTFVDSCVSRTTPGAVEQLYVVYSWLILIDLMALGFGLVFVGFRSVLFKW